MMDDWEGPLHDKAVDPSVEEVNTALESFERELSAEKLWEELETRREAEAVDEGLALELEDLYWCTCQPVGVFVPWTFGHDPDCKLRLCKEWMDHQAEWDNEGEQFLWFGTDIDEDGHPLKGGVLDDGKTTVVEHGITDAVTLPEAELTCVCNPAKEYYCEPCGVERKSPKLPWSKLDSLETTFTGTTYGFQGPSTYFVKCRHTEEPVTFPNGLTVYASSSMGQKAPEGQPHLGLYAASRTPRSVSMFIPWADFGLPSCAFLDAAGAIQYAYQTAADGFVVEVGCIGGHGRTGTMLACMAVLAGVPGDEAVAWVRENYCSHAVESEMQEWWVLWFAAWHLGVAAPPYPHKEVIAVSTTSQKSGPPPGYKADDKCAVCGSRLGDGPCDVYMCWKKDCSNYFVKAPIVAGPATPTASTALALSPPPKQLNLQSNEDTCPLCDSLLRANPLRGYMCWYMSCPGYAVKANSPAAVSLRVRAAATNKPTNQTRRLTKAERRTQRRAQQSNH